MEFMFEQFSEPVLEGNRGVSSYAARGRQKSERSDQVGQQIKRACNPEIRFSSVEESTSLDLATSKSRRSLLRPTVFFG